MTPFGHRVTRHRQSLWVQDPSRVDAVLEKVMTLYQILTSALASPRLPVKVDESSMATGAIDPVLYLPVGSRNVCLADKPTWRQSCAFKRIPVGAQGLIEWSGDQNRDWHWQSEIARLFLSWLSCYFCLGILIKLGSFIRQQILPKKRNVSWNSCVLKLSRNINKNCSSP